MAHEIATLLRDLNPVVETAPAIGPEPRNLRAQRKVYRDHIINRLQQERSGRLYCNDNWEFEIPSLELYDAR
jgi:hypothetical protein